MEQTYQMENLNVLQHGQMVWKYYQKLLNNDTDDMRIPNWFSQYRTQILANLYSQNMIQEYTIYHDIGKIVTISIDENGKRHFPNHAVASESMWLEMGGDPTIARLMGLDMIFHTETAEQIIERNLDIKMICTLMLAALAELHANANMFGGIKSESFCIKFKKLEKRAKKICQHYFLEMNNPT